MTSVNGTQWEYTVYDCTSGQSVCYWDKACPIIAVIEEVYSLKDGSKAIPEAPYPAARACSAQSTGWRGTIQLLFSSLLESHYLRN